MSTSHRPAPVTRLDQAKVSSYFGCDTFNWRTMQERLPKDVFRALRRCIRKGERLSPEIAHVIAQSMKDWALEHGATHFTHWFQPMTGATAEKHDAFITWDDNGGLIESFSGSQLIQGEPDASSFPSGGLRTTFEARGYTAWDPASAAFLMTGAHGRTLCIPTAFIGYHGEALDHKVPLLRSMEYLSKQAVAGLKLLGVEASVITAQCGAEQEYFLIDRAYYDRRPDLKFANRTLQGARPPKGQELEDHYFGAIKERVLRFMQDLEVELFRLGIPAKTRHNEVAPNQFELAPIYEPANVAADHNQLLMEVMKKIGEKNGLAVLLNEKPFQGVNGSGKHCNWSFSTEEGVNLLDPGNTPEQNVQFLYFLGAVLLGVHRHGGLLRAAIASASNDHRLGANEAPPAILSVFLGEQLGRILDHIERGAAADATERKILDLGLTKLPVLAKDYTDRNRTSPFAFTGNKFEFRAVGAGQPIAVPLSILNTAVGDAIETLNQRVLKKAAGSGDGPATPQVILEVLREVITETRPIRFDGNGYSPEWRKEAERRGLPHARDTAAALEIWEQPVVRELLARAAVLSGPEQDARTHVRHEQFQKALVIEAQVLRELAETLILPATLQDLRHKNELHGLFGGVQGAGVVINSFHKQRDLIVAAYTCLEQLKEALGRAEHMEDMHARTRAFAEQVRPAQQALREVLDHLEEVTDARLWPLPKYREMLAEL